MDREYEALPIRELGAGAEFHRPKPAQSARVTLESPALQVMTDLEVARTFAEIESAIR